MAYVYVKLIDFSISKVYMKNTLQVCGSEENLDIIKYMTLEVIKNNLIKESL